MTVSVGVLSIGDMGMGIARLLKANSYRVLTVGAGRRYVHLCTLLIFINLKC